MLAGTMSLLRVNAAAATVLSTDTDSPRSGCVFLGIEGKYITQIQEALDRINEIRREACEDGVENPSSPGSYLTTNDYVPIQWSADLEYIARLRAAESALTMAHERLNGQSIWNLSGPNGERSFGEVIAWNWGESMVSGIEQWYGEKNAWVNKTGGVTGHYTQMIDPKHLYVGMGTFCSNSAKYYNTTVGEFGSNLGNSTTSRGSSTGTVIQTLEVQNSIISYEIYGTDLLSVAPAVTYNNLKTSGLMLIGDSAEEVRWSSSNSEIVSVENGRVKVNKCGSAVITATMPDGRSLTKTVSYDHSYNVASTTEATYKEEGEIVEKCSVCGDTVTTTSPKTNQHTFGNWEAASAPTESGEVTEKRICAVCGLEETRTQYYTNWGTSSNATDTSGELGFLTPSGNNSSSTSSGGNSSSASSGNNYSSTPQSDNSSPDSPNGDVSASLSSDSSFESSPDSEVQSVDASVSSGVTNASDNKNSSGILPLLIAGGLLLASGSTVVVILLIQRKNKLK